METMVRSLDQFGVDCELRSLGITILVVGLLVVDGRLISLVY